MTQEVIQSDKWTSGDFQLTSSDGVVFKVDSYYLFAVSGVFRDGRSHNSTAKAVFTDETVENAVTINHFLTYITTGSLDDLSRHARSLNATHELLNLLDFLSKYDCVMWRELFLCYATKLYADRKIGSLTLFLIGAYGDKVELCLAALDS